MTTAVPDRAYRYYEFVMAAFVTILICSNLIGPAKIAQIEVPVLGALTFGTLYKGAAWTQPAKGFSRAIDFQFDGTHWIETGRTFADVPN